MRLPTSLVVALTVGLAAMPVGAAPEGQITWGVHTTLVPSYFDPAETLIGTSFMMLYGLHDALVKPMPGQRMAPSLAESWSVSADGLVYDFVLRKGVKFHNDELLTAEDVRFSFERYRGIHARQLKERVAAVDRALESYVVGGGSFAYGSHPDIDGLIREQATMLDRARREATLHRIQQLVHERVMFAPIDELAFVNGVGRRIEEAGLGLIAGYAFSAPYEDVKLRPR